MVNCRARSIRRAAARSTPAARSRKRGARRIDQHWTGGVARGRWRAFWQVLRIEAVCGARACSKIKFPAEASICRDGIVIAVRPVSRSIRLGDDMQRPIGRRSLAAMAGGAALLAAAPRVRAQGSNDPIKIGILHSLSGTMAISETTLKDVMLMLIDEQNKKGGVLGQQARGRGRRPGVQLAAVRRKGPPAHHRRQGRRRVRLLDQRVAQVRAAGVRGAGNILFYPVQYEGEESSKNVFYTGAAPNQQAIPAVDYLMPTRTRCSAGCWPARTTSIRAPPTRSSKPT